VNLSAAEGTEKVSLICRQNLSSYNYLRKQNTCVVVFLLY